MIEILYTMGESVWRESALQIFSMRVDHEDIKTKKPVVINAIATVKEDGYVYVFYKAGMSMGECNDLIVNSIGEIDLRRFEIFGIHTMDEFLKMRDTGKGNKAVHLESKTGVGIGGTPPNETRAAAKEEAREKRRAANKKNNN